MTDPRTTYTVRPAPMVKWTTTDAEEAERYSRAGARVTAVTEGVA